MPSVLNERLPEREALLAQLEVDGHLRDPRLEEAMLAVPRHRFVPDERLEEAYHDKPLPVEDGQTISAPHMVAMMTEALMLEPGQNVLEIGGGRGYHAAVMQELVGPDGHVTAVEFLQSLVERAHGNLASIGSQATVVQGDGADGWAADAPYDAILITCAVPHLPEILWDQLTDDGHIVAPIGVTECMLTVFRKGNEVWTEEPLGPCLFVNAQGRLAGNDDLLSP